MSEIDTEVVRRLVTGRINANLLRRSITQSMGVDVKANQANLPSVVMACSSRSSACHCCCAQASAARPPTQWGRGRPQLGQPE